MASLQSRKYLGVVDYAFYFLRKNISTSLEILRCGIVLEKEKMVRISEELFRLRISFRKGEEFLPFPVDDVNPTLPGSKYFLSKVALGQISSTWKQWKKFVNGIMSKPEGRTFVSQFFPEEYFASGNSAPETSGWGTRKRSEIEWFTAGQEYFPSPHVTRIDFGLTAENRLVIIDPNVMPYGVTPMVAAQELLGLKTQEPYLEKLTEFSPTWVSDRAHGSAHSLRWLTDRVRASFAFSDEFSGADNVVRLSRKEIRGGRATVGAPGIRLFESQVWNALLNITGLPEFFGFNADVALHRANCVATYLVRLHEGSLEVGLGFSRGQIQWVSFEDFISSRWGSPSERVFLKCLATSGCRQVTFSGFKQKEVYKAVYSKLSLPTYFLLQPALPCLIDGERVRVSSYLGPNKGEHYGSEVTRVPAEQLLSHGGTHAKISYLVL
ncbi:hypothetical protein A3A95_01195 [Candidatus Nomurabacteria bacterium RIFCSPLOWO2_01_FULL_39_18]|uniref:Uncharacterized protein n=1 Tax=Candidatus Nomurabacteria bacterium RIFCSPHIGHO2_01_FULL_40_24b TaxID=1801739 RepID=A0A1F6V8X1_9BACT|nr:MAG: hypothetical protein A2647_01510 [Candidatus Nomurabacteria bacterium RIFCSPHIGHO2_01_FULL_40_24b]OGI89921.1 MAG: hypothetical protein A3A95_01195 [Candidatus Nomurabacteria bacterium RIFCSPLOWO2_01_FULL_39_18]